MHAVPAPQGLDCERVVPSVVPRFIPTCSQELLSGLGDLAQAEGLVVHSHISESRWVQGGNYWHTTVASRTHPWYMQLKGIVRSPPQPHRLECRSSHIPCNYTATQQPQLGARPHFAGPGSTWRPH